MGRRVAAAALLALGSMVPHDGPLLAAPAQIAPVADTGVARPLTVGTATTDPALANDAARAIAVGFAVTDCMPDAELLAAAEARALIPMGTPAATGGSGIVGTSSGIVGTSSGSAAGATANGSAPVDPPTTASPTTDSPTTDATATAADTFAWGTPTGVDDFDGTLSNWRVYDGPGHAGNGRRSRPR